MVSKKQRLNTDWTLQCLKILSFKIWRKVQHLLSFCERALVNAEDSHTAVFPDVQRPNDSQWLFLHQIFVQTLHRTLVRIEYRPFLHLTKHKECLSTVSHFQRFKRFQGSKRSGVFQFVYIQSSYIGAFSFYFAVCKHCLCLFMCRRYLQLFEINSTI